MIQTLTIYILLTVLMYTLVNFSLKFRVKRVKLFSIANFPVLFALLCYAYIFGVRYGVGIDYFAYQRTFLGFQNISNFVDERIEPGFGFIIQSMAEMQFHYSWFFGVIAFLQLAFIFYAFRKQREILPYLVLTFMLMTVWLSYANGLRQQLAFCIFVYSLNFVVEKKLIKYYLLVLLAVSMHKSAWLLLPVYPLFNYKQSWFTNIRWQYFLLAISLILLNVNIIQDFFVRLDNVTALLGYDGYMNVLDRGSEHLLNSLNRDRGIGFYTLLLTDVLLIFTSNRVKQYFSNTTFPMMYDLYFVGVLWNYVFNASIIMGRPNYYMFGFKFIIAAFTLCYLHKTRFLINNNRILFVGIFTCLLLIFIGTIYRMDTNTAEYIFYWQTELYHLKNYVPTNN